jgi:hypothetical protein
MPRGRVIRWCSHLAIAAPHSVLSQVCSRCPPRLSHQILDSLGGSNILGSRWCLVMDAAVMPRQRRAALHRRREDACLHACLTPWLFVASWAAKSAQAWPWPRGHDRGSGLDVSEPRPPARCLGPASTIIHSRLSASIHLLVRPLLFLSHFVTVNTP